MDDPFEKQYIRLRCKEKRLYKDEEVSNLPYVPESHIHYKEWQLRKWSADKLVSFLGAKNKPLNILEIGCGNGWLSFQLSTLKDSRVIGQDINFTELQQAARVFNGNAGLRFVCGNMFSDILANQYFDVIVFAASIQYFPSFNSIMQLALNKLHKDGEIHIIDSHFYQPAQLTAARQRTAAYYQSLGQSEMINYYFHHSVKDLSAFRFRYLYNPKSVTNRIFNRKRIFPWIQLQKNDQ